MFKNHLAMIGYNESPNKKAKFWQSYIRSLKGKSSCGNFLSRQLTDHPLQDLRTFVPMKAAKTTAPHTQSTMKHRLLTAESLLLDTVTYQCTERPTDTPHVPSTHIHLNDQVCQAQSCHKVHFSDPQHWFLSI